VGDPIVCLVRWRWSDEDDGEVVKALLTNEQQERMYDAAEAVEADLADFSIVPELDKVFSYEELIAKHAWMGGEGDHGEGGD
jgi:hypothetical protein